MDAGNMPSPCCQRRAALSAQPRWMNTGIMLGDSPGRRFQPVMVEEPTVGGYHLHSEGD